MIAPERYSTAMGAELADLRVRMQRRIDAGTAYGERCARAMATCAAEMADRFWDGATLLVIGSGAGVTDAQHNAVEYVHPVLPGCRALPALALAADWSAPEAVGAIWDRPLRALARPEDILLVFTDGGDAPARQALRTASGLGLLTIAVTAGEAGVAVEAGHVLATGATDALIAQELQLATYHVLWELVHIILNHRGSGGVESRR